MSFPINVGRNRWQEALEEVLGGGAGLVEAAARNFYQNGIAPGITPSQPQPIPNPQFQTHLPGKPGFEGFITGNQGRTINHPVQQYQGQQPRSFMDQLLGRDPNKPAPGTVVLPGPAMNDDLAKIAAWSRFQNADFKGGGGQQVQSMPDPVQMDQMPADVAQREFERQTQGMLPAGVQQRNADAAARSEARRADEAEWSYANKSFAEVANEAARRLGEGQTVNGERLTEWDTEDIYQVVNQLDREDYDAINQITDPRELTQVTGQTTLDLLEEAGFVVEPEVEQQFLNGLHNAMVEWYNTRRAKKQTTDITDMFMAQTQIALTLLEQEVPVQQTAATGTTPAATAPVSTQQQIDTASSASGLDMNDPTNWPPELQAGYGAWLQTLPDDTPEEEMTIEAYLRAYGG